jgi:hypothetical protein
LGEHFLISFLKPSDAENRKNNFSLFRISQAPPRHEKSSNMGRKKKRKKIIFIPTASAMDMM